VSPVKYKLGFYIPEDDILHSHRPENLKSYIHRSMDHEVVPGMIRVTEGHRTHTNTTNIPKRSTTLELTTNKSAELGA
jgi:hypothetical protein